MRAYSKIVKAASLLQEALNDLQGVDDYGLDEVLGSLEMSAGNAKEVSAALEVYNQEQRRKR